MAITPAAGLISSVQLIGEIGGMVNLVNVVSVPIDRQSGGKKTKYFTDWLVDYLSIRHIYICRTTLPLP